MLEFLRLLIVLVLILNTGSVVFILNKELIYLLPILVLSLYIFDFNRKALYTISNFNISIVYILIFCILVIYINLIHFVYLDVEPKLYLSLFIKVSSILMFLKYYKIQFYSFDVLSYDIYKVLKIILYIGVLNMILINIWSSLFLLTERDSFHVYTIGGIFNYLSIININGFNLYRNQGLFWEPGVFQLFLNILLFQALFKYKQYMIVLVSSLTILSTFSTVGILIMCTIFSFYFIRTKSINYKVIGLVLISLVFVPLSFYSLYEKFTGADSLSASLRTYDLYIGSKIFLDNFLFGIGFNPEFYIKHQSEINQTFLKLNELRGNTNGIISVGFYFGIFGVLTYIYMLIKQSVFHNNQFLVFLIFLLTLFSEPLPFTGFILLFILSSLYKNPKSIINLKKKRLS